MEEIKKEKEIKLTEDILDIIDYECKHCAYGNCEACPYDL
jgi:hypothetical protein